MCGVCVCGASLLHLTNTGLLQTKAFDGVVSTEASLPSEQPKHGITVQYNFGVVLGCILRIAEQERGIREIVSIERFDHVQSPCCASLSRASQSSFR